MKPELLLPAGNIEAFYAALEGGADAIYLGLNDFNARKRANNFTIPQIPTLLRLAHKQKVKVFITLNTVIKNEELESLYLTLFQLSQYKIDAVIIQDWGTYHLIKKHFPKIEVHASTQMAFHNSAGANFGKKVGLNRIILARELTMSELIAIRKKSKVELELFVHGALCYSFSGLCLFSSFLGGMSANRGACTQPCRRVFKNNGTEQHLFSLKDNELIDFIPELSNIGINSLKIEGRMKSADYVYRIAKSYRMVIDNPDQVNEAKELLKHDVGREKTSYFIGGNVSEAITTRPNTGFLTGKIINKSNNGFGFTSKISPKGIKRIRVCSPSSEKQINIKVHSFEIKNDLIYIKNENSEVSKGDLVYITGFASKKFPQKLPLIKPETPKRPITNEAKNKTQHLIKSNNINRVNLYFRIDSLAWLRKVRLEDIDFLILNMPFKELENIPINSKFLFTNRNKLVVEFPKIIREDSIEKYKCLANDLFVKGITIFSISHISQIAILPDKASIVSNENVYTFNDAAIAQLKLFKISTHTYPLENDIRNMIAGKDRSGIVPLHFTPQLFYSRMPVSTFNKSNDIKDDTNIDFSVVKREGITITIPRKPVSVLQNKKDLIQKGFKRFLIDVSFQNPSQNTFKTLIKKYYKAEQIQPSTSFNFKKGLS